MKRYATHYFWITSSNFTPLNYSLARRTSTSIKLDNKAKSYLPQRSTRRAAWCYDLKFCAIERSRRDVPARWIEGCARCRYRIAIIRVRRRCFETRDAARLSCRFIITFSFCLSGGAKTNVACVICFCALSQGKVCFDDSVLSIFFSGRRSSSLLGVSQLSPHWAKGGRGEGGVFSLRVSPVRISYKICKIMCEDGGKRVFFDEYVLSVLT